MIPKTSVKPIPGNKYGNSVLTSVSVKHSPKILFFREGRGVGRRELTLFETPTPESTVVKSRKQDAHKSKRLVLENPRS